jgi:hypothetical protein
MKHLQIIHPISLPKELLIDELITQMVSNNFGITSCNKVKSFIRICLSNRERSNAIFPAKPKSKNAVDFFYKRIINKKNGLLFFHRIRIFKNPK